MRDLIMRFIVREIEVFSRTVDLVQRQVDTVSAWAEEYFLSPAAFWLVMLPVALMVAYLLRSRKSPLVWESAASVTAAVKPTRQWGRKFGVTAALAAMALPIYVMAQPYTSTTELTADNRLVIVVDSSTSMYAEDCGEERRSRWDCVVESVTDAYDPNLEAEISLVEFGPQSTFYDEIDDREALESTLGGIDLQEGGTASGDALKSVVDTCSALTSADGKPVKCTVVVLTDGARTDGITMEEAAQKAVDSGVVDLYTVSFGQEGSVAVLPDGRFFDASPAPEELAQASEIAQTTPYSVSDADALTQVYREVQAGLERETLIHSTYKSREITYGAAGLLALLAFMFVTLAMPVTRHVVKIQS